MDNIFSILSSIVWSIVEPDRLLLLTLCVGCILLFTHNIRMGRLVVVCTCILSLVIAVLPVEDWLLFPLEERFPPVSVLPESLDGIIVLAGAENSGITLWRGQPVLSDGAERLTAFIALARKYPEAKLIVSDGPVSQARDGNVGAVTAKMLFDSLGLDLSRVQFEERSGNTYENAVFSHPMAQPKGTEKWLLITSAFHIPRSVGVFRKVGWEVIPYPVDYRVEPDSFSLNLNPAGSLIKLSIGLKEWGALVTYWLMSRTSAIFPARLAQ